MRNIEIELTEKEELKLEYYNYQFNGIKLIVEQFMQTGYDYNEEHYNRIINTYSDKYADLKKCLYNILNNHSVKDIPIIEFSYYINNHTLMITTSR